VYGFLLINHLGEPFERSERACRDDDQALEYAQALSARGFTVEARLGEARIALITPKSWEPYPWLKPLLQ
jgi:hypothetical protein